MCLAGKANHYGGNFLVLERAKHFFAAGVGGRPPVSFAKYQHQRRFYIVDISDWRARFEIFGIVEGRGLKPGRLKQSEVSRVPPIGPTGDVALRDGGREPSGVTNRPIR